MRAVLMVVQSSLEPFCCCSATTPPLWSGVTWPLNTMGWRVSPLAELAARLTSASTRSCTVRLWVAPGPRTNHSRLVSTMPSWRVNSY